MQGTLGGALYKWRSPTVGSTFKKSQSLSDQKQQKLDNITWLSYCILYSHVTDSIDTRRIHPCWQGLPKAYWNRGIMWWGPRNISLAKSQQAVPIGIFHLNAVAPKWAEVKPTFFSTCPVPVLCLVHSRHSGISFESTKLLSAISSRTDILDSCSKRCLWKEVSQ